MNSSPSVDTVPDINTGGISRRGTLRLLLGGTAATLLPFEARAFAAGSSPKKSQNPAVSDGLPRSRPEAQGISPDAILAFLDDARSSGFELHGFMLWRHGHVVAEGWWEPYRADRIHMMHSLTKSVTSAAVGLAIADGRFGLEDKVVSFFKEYLPETVSDNLAAMTVEDLLTMRTGHASMVSGSVWRQIKTSWIAEFFKIPVVYKPGTKFVYTSAATYMLSGIVTKTTGQTVVDYLKPRIFDPLGISGYDWPTGPDGISPGANGLSWKTSDSLKFGVLHAQDGMWNGQQLLPKSWVDAVHQQHVPGKYGYQWWLGQDDAYLADGVFTQYSVVFPKQNAVLAINAAIPLDSGFSQLLYRHFPAAFQDTPPSGLPLDNRSLKKLKARTDNLELLPPFVATTSPVIQHVSGKTYQFSDNAAQVKSVRFDFAEDACAFSLVDERGTHTIRVGLRQPIEGNTTMTGNDLHHEYQPDIMRVVASGTWQDERTFVMTWTFVESAFRDTVVCQFAGPHLRIDRGVNVNSAATQMPTLNGLQAGQPT
ncbi:serine hydrolase [Paraburkholderia xenovorans]|uniref:serine hydrolase domain-containing protein n=1 Tax=Paraburkholderia xenovorans TaxID=36873 RepID=UPI0038BD5173